MMKKTRRLLEKVEAGEFDLPEEETPVTSASAAEAEAEASASAPTS